MAGSYSSSGSSGKTSSTSRTTSTPQLMSSPQSDWELQLSQLLGNLGQSQYQWAQQQFGNAQNVTDQQINNYLQGGSYGMNMAANLMGRYENTFQPLEDQYIQEAGSYASAPRINFNMGQAQSRAAQAGTQALNNARQQLQEFGINPSSGMYGELEEAGNAQRAASAAGAGTEAGLATEQTGRQMLQNAVAMGQQLPGATVNALNAAYGGISGAENSILGLENTGSTLMDSASPFFNSGMQLKYPGVGQNTVSNSSSSGTSASASQSAPGQSGNGGGGGGARGPGGGGTATDGNPVGWPSQNGGGYGGNGSASNGPLINQGNYSNDTWDTFGTGSGADTSGTVDTSGFTDPNLSANNFQTYGSDWGGGYSTQSYSPSNMGAYGGYARGGDVLPSNRTTGGFVPRSASPSSGAQTDDIPARLNAREFVIPTDVTDWYGQKTFQDMIKKARAAMTSPEHAGAQGQPKPPLPGPPRFVSHPVLPGRP